MPFLPLPQRLEIWSLAPRPVPPTYDLPYALARRFSNIDHLADGRVAWNIVTSYLNSAARNLGLSTQIEHDERYRTADEYMDVVYKLWEGNWRDDAVVRDVENGQYAVPERVWQTYHKEITLTCCGLIRVSHFLNGLRSSSRLVPQNQVESSTPSMQKPSS